MAHSYSFVPWSANPLEATADALLAELQGLFQVNGVSFHGYHEGEITFTGRYPHRSDAPYEEIRKRFSVLGYTPLLRREKDHDELLAFKGVVDKAATGNPLINVLLLLVTILTTLAAGAALAGDGSFFRALLAGEMRPVTTAARLGAPFAITLLGILGVHEFGHYVAARLHGVAATLPYFIPMPIGGLGTLGAFISVRSPMKNRTVLFDIGLAGPIAGFIVALPLLVVGLLLSEPVPAYTRGLTLRGLGSSVLVDFIIRVATDLGAGQTLRLHPVFFAAWLGVLITGINLLPIGQLDGGHVAYGLMGRSAHSLARGSLILLFVAGIVLSPTWLLWAVFVLFGGLHHPPPLNDITGLSRSRQVAGVLTGVLFFLIITPAPFA
jgi:membrane-associated protease RseP (regulator of RpoE activity)